MIGLTPNISRTIHVDERALDPNHVASNLTQEKVIEGLGEVRREPTEQWVRQQSREPKREIVQVEANFRTVIRS